jgi:hypothetical protein
MSHGSGAFGERMTGSDPGRPRSAKGGGAPQELS